MSFDLRTRCRAASVRAQWAGRETRAVMEVRDSGPGIPESVLLHVIDGSTSRTRPGPAPRAADSDSRSLPRTYMCTAAPPCGEPRRGRCRLHRGTSAATPRRPAHGRPPMRPARRPVAPLPRPPLLCSPLLAAALFTPVRPSPPPRQPGWQALTVAGHLRSQHARQPGPGAACARHPAHLLPPWTRRRRPAKLHADKGYDYEHLRRWLRNRGIRHRIARNGIVPSQRLGRHRWVVERTVPRLAGCLRCTAATNASPSTSSPSSAIAATLTETAAEHATDSTTAARRAAVVTAVAQLFPRAG